VLLNAAAALLAADLAADMPAALAAARASLDSGQAHVRLERLVEVSNAG
jgi:anthranilate phosphoribosyltransferase